MAASVQSCAGTRWYLYCGTIWYHRKTIQRPMRQESVIPGQTGGNPLHKRILRAAFEAFTEEGYAGTSTLDIATRARVSKRDLYANFGSKHEVLVACIKSRADRMRLLPGL